MGGGGKEVQRTRDASGPLHPPLGYPPPGDREQTSPEKIWGNRCQLRIKLKLRRAEVGATCTLLRHSGTDTVDLPR